MAPAELVRFFVLMLELYLGPSKSYIQLYGLWGPLTLHTSLPHAAYPQDETAVEK